MKRWLSLGSLLAALVVFGQTAQAQIPLSVRLIQDDVTVAIGNGSTITLNSLVGASSSAEVELVYRGSGTLTVLTPPELAGTSSFDLTTTGSFPANLAPGGSLRFRLTYRPRNSNQAAAQLTVSLREQPPATVPNTTVTPVSGFLSLNVLGTAPDFIVSYILPTDGNVVPVAPGGTVSLAPVLPDTVTAATISIANQGSGAGRITSVAVSGDGFQILGLPLLPGTLAALREIRFTLRSAARQAGDYQGTLRIGIDGVISEYPILARVLPPNLSYELAVGDRIDTIQPGAATDLGQFTPGEAQTFQLAIRNGGELDVPLTNLSLTGNGFSFVELPTNRTLSPGQSTRLVVNFLPTIPGAYRARLRVNNDTFEFTAAGIGARLRYSYQVPNTENTIVAAGGAVFLAATPVGSRNSATFSVTNIGSTRANVIQVTVDAPRGGFSISNLPTLPRVLEPGEVLSFQIDHAPTSLSATSATLRVDGASFPITVVSPAAPPVPDIEITPASGNVNPLEQPAVSIRLVQPYSLPIAGTLTLSQESAAFFSDPSVRFPNGQTSIAFTIPANSTSAVFPSGGTQTRIQTGSVAGDILLGVSLNSPIASGDATSPLKSVRLTVPALAPTLFGASVVLNNSQLNLSITGMSTTRSLTSMEVELVPQPGVTVTNPKFTINLVAESLFWFRSASSQAAGGVFQITVPIGLTVTGDANAKPLQAVKVTVSNERGASNALTANIP